MSEKRGPGRESAYTPEIAAEILDLVSAGKSLRSICELDGMPDERTVRRWASENREGFAPQYEAARNIALDILADEVLSIADQSDGDVPRDRLRFDARRWYLSKLAPKRYGDKVTHAGDPDNPVAVEDVTEARRVLREKLLSMSGRRPDGDQQ